MFSIPAPSISITIPVTNITYNGGIFLVTLDLSQVDRTAPGSIEVGAATLDAPPFGNYSGSTNIQVADIPLNNLVQVTATVQGTPGNYRVIAQVSPSSYQGFDIIPPFESTASYSFP